MKYSIEGLGSENTFRVPCEMCSADFEGADELRLKALLLLLCEGKTDSAELSARLGCTEKELAGALDHWVDMGLFSRCGGKFTAATAPSQIKEDTSTGSGAPSAASSDSAVPLLTSSEAARRISESEELRFFIEQAEHCFGRLLSSSETTHLLSIIDYTGLTPDVMLMLVQYCRAADRCTISYIKKISSSWAEKGIKTHRAADAEIKAMAARNEAAALVREVFEIHGRDLIAKEREFAQAWVQELKMSRLMLAEAFSRCVLATGKCDFRYIDKVLRSWSALGIEKPEDIEKHGRKTASPTAPDKSDDDLFMKNAIKKKKI